MDSDEWWGQPCNYAHVRFFLKSASTSQAMRRASGWSVGALFEIPAM